jgi:hypothetical protein
MFFESEELGAMDALEVLLLEVYRLNMTLEVTLPRQTLAADVTTVPLGISICIQNNLLLIFVRVSS